MGRAVRVGLNELAWMAGIAVVFLAEKNWRHGVGLTKVVGIACWASASSSWPTRRFSGPWPGARADMSSMPLTRPKGSYPTDTDVPSDGMDQGPIPSRRRIM